MITGAETGVVASVIASAKSGGVIDIQPTWTCRVEVRRNGVISRHNSKAPATNAQEARERIKAALTVVWGVGQFEILSEPTKEAVC